MKINLSTGDKIPRERLLERLVENLYTRNDLVLSRGNFRVRGEIIDIFPAYMEAQFVSNYGVMKLTASTNSTL